jgi:DNA-directed RNA polymerase specialized sigma24 family protein
MNDRLLVDALRSRDPGALAAVYDAHAASLYAYCWSQLLGRDAAQVALRDTLIVAEAHIDRLRDPDRFKPWLYAIARLECDRRRPMPGTQPDLPVAIHDQDDVDQRLMAWNTVRALSGLSRELLELRLRRGLPTAEVAVVLDLPPRETEQLIIQATEDLSAALTAEILGRLGPYGCEERAVILRERNGELDPPARASLLAHAACCAVCGAHRPTSQVSPAKVLGMLPEAVPPVSLRLRVMSCFTDPELVSYRLFVATRITEFTPAGFPLQARRGVQAPADPNRRRTRIMLVSLALVVGIGAAASLVRWTADEQREVAQRAASGASQSSPTPTLSKPSLPQRLDRPPISATYPLGAEGSAAPSAASPPTPHHISQALPEGGIDAPPGGKGRLVVSPCYLDIGAGADGTLILEATGGTLVWRAVVRGPIRLSVHSGRLKKGQTVTLRVRVFRKPGSRGEGTIKVGGRTVTVTWRPVPPPDQPSPTPTDVPSSPSPEPSTPPGHSAPPRSGPPTDPPHSDPPDSDPPNSDPPGQEPTPDHTHEPTHEPPTQEPPKEQPSESATAAPSPTS